MRNRHMGKCWPLLTGVRCPLWPDCLPGLPKHGCLSLFLPWNCCLESHHHHQACRGRGRSPVLTLVRADATTSRDGLPFSVGCGISSVKVTHNTEDAAMHAGQAIIQHWLFPGSCTDSVSQRCLALLEGFLGRSPDRGSLAKGGEGTLSF